MHMNELFILLIQFIYRYLNELYVTLGLPRNKEIKLAKKLTCRYVVRKRDAIMIHVLFARYKMKLDLRERYIDKT